MQVLLKVLTLQVWELELAPVSAETPVASQRRKRQGSPASSSARYFQSVRSPIPRARPDGLTAIRNEFRTELMRLKAEFTKVEPEAKELESEVETDASNVEVAVETETEKVVEEVKTEAEKP